MERALVTGISLICAVGLEVEECWGNLVRGVSGVGPITHFDASAYPTRIAAEVKGFDPRPYMDPKAARRMSRPSQLAVAVARQAVDDAGLELAREDPTRVGVVMNTGGGGVAEVERETEVLLTRGPGRVNPFLLPRLIANMVSCQVSIELGIQGPVSTGVAACASGISSLVEALRLVRLGECDVVIAGSSEADILMPLAFAALGNMGAISRRNDEPTRASRPFDRDRDGFVLGEGAGALVIESERHARARGARVLCELAGGAMTADAYHIVAPEPSGAGAALAMTRALASAGVRPEEVDYICAHGTGTPLNDVAETVAIKRALGDHARRVAISSPKSMVGHLLGAAGAVSAACAVLAIRDGVIPPTTNLENPDPECDLDYTPLVARERKVRVSMANGFGFGGQNAVVVFRAWAG